MRLHRLTMTAIGPFADQVDIDFSAVGASGLFLLEGPNGSGKSTVIDAISFALYGKSAQESAHADRMRSHFATPGTEPVVDLVFETQSGLFRVRRTPSFERPKKSGSGTTTANPTAKLWRLGTPDDLSSGDLLTTRIDEVAREVERAIGLTHGQFVQTVILPQGEFAKFLRATTDERRTLLQRLFGTEQLAWVQKQLVEGRQAALQRRTKVANTIRDAVQGFIGAAGVDDELAAEFNVGADLPNVTELAILTHKVTAELSASALDSAEHMTTAAVLRANAHAEVQRAEGLLIRRNRRAELLTRQGRLAEQHHEHESLRTELAAAERAAAIHGAVDAAQSAQAYLLTAERLVQSTRRLLPEHLHAADEPALRRAAGDLRTLSGELAEDVRREQTMGPRHSEHTRLITEIARTSAAMSELRDELDAIPSRSAQLTTDRERVTKLSGQVEVLTESRARASARSVAAMSAMAAAGHLEQQVDNVTGALAVLQQQEADLGRLRSARIASIAGELGLELGQGEPCPVCGSADHPAPACPGDDHVTERDVRIAESTVLRLRQDADDHGQLLAQSRAELAALRAEAGQLSPAEAQADLDRATSTLDAAIAANDQLEEITAELSSVTQRTSSLTAHLSEAVREHSLIIDRAATIRASVEADAVLVRVARGHHASVVGRIEALRADAIAVDATAGALAGAVSAAATRQRQHEALAIAIAGAGFGDVEAWQLSRRSERQLTQLRNRSRAINDELAGVSAGLAAPDLADPALDDEPADLASLSATLRGAEALEQQATAVHGSLRDRHIAATRYADLLIGAANKGDRVLSETAPAIRLGNLVAASTSDNRLRMELTTYILVRRFAEVLKAANTQLRRVSGGRYELEHSAAKSGNRSSGLGMQVTDLRTGRSRDPGTLSGGETFYVSLSLALGLADVVRAESGGIDLGTLFIDEGFGALDPEVLDEVLAVLDTLRKAGRMVGVISHMPDVKVRISDRIEVRRNPDGSSRLRTTV
jgi:exonuclease SbcC